jgi:D-lactate dehydrogenase (cytochrome)
MMRAINQAGLVENPYPISDTLFLKIQGTKESLSSASPLIQSICAQHGSTAFDFAETDEKAEELWMNRKYALMSTMAAEPGHRCWTTDVWWVPSFP